MQRVAGQPHAHSLGTGHLVPSRDRLDVLRRVGQHFVLNEPRLAARRLVYAGVQRPGVAAGAATATGRPAAANAPGPAAATRRPLDLCDFRRWWQRATARRRAEQSSSGVATARPLRLLRVFQRNIQLVDLGLSEVIGSLSASTVSALHQTSEGTGRLLPDDRM